MREIKLRYVFKRKSDAHVYIIGVDIAGVEQGSGELRGMLENDLWELAAREQFYGVTDKNGVDIYEGDILTWDIIKAGYSGRYRETVIFSEGRFLPVVHAKHNPEVIGNIHENPDIMGGMK